MPDLRVAMRNLEQFSAGSGLDFNVSRPLSRAKITEGLFQQNRPKAAGHHQQLSSTTGLSPEQSERHSKGRFILIAAGWSIRACRPKQPFSRRAPSGRIAVQNKRLKILHSPVGQDYGLTQFTTQL